MCKARTNGPGRLGVGFSASLVRTQVINNLKLPMIFAYLGSEGLARRRLELETPQEKATWWERVKVMLAKGGMLHPDAELVRH